MTMKFEQVQKHVEAVDLKALEARDKAMAQANLCGIWQAARPVISLLSSIPFLPAKWTALIKQFSATLDMICPVGP